MLNRRALKGIVPQAVTRHMLSALRARPKLILGLGVLGLLSIMLGAYLVREQARHKLSEERARLARQEFIPFEKSTRAPLARSEIKFWQSTDNTRAVVRFEDSYFAATDGGLVQFSPEGNLSRHYTVLDGLTESDLTALAVFDSKLFIGTATRGLLSFDGERFQSYRWLDREPQAVTAMLANEGRLLIGTFSGGLIEFDGQHFVELKAGAERVRLRGVNCLSKDGPRLYVGTYDDGLWLLDAGRWLHFGETDGLASNRVVGIAASGEEVLVASDFGLSVATTASLFVKSEAGQKCFSLLATLPSLTSLVEDDDFLLLSKDDGQLLALDKGSSAHARALVKNLDWARPKDLSSSRLTMVDENLWLLSGHGIWRAEEKDSLSQPREALSLTSFGQTDHNQSLASNVISALALDSDGKFWAGNFRRGVDIFSAEGKKLTHLESEAIREVNFLLPEAGTEPTVLAATSQGVVDFDAHFRSTSVTKADGLPSNSVMHLALDEDKNPSTARAPQTSSMALATARGLSLNQSGRWRALTTVQGLPSNQVYATLFFKRSLFVGTLGGLAQVERGRVVRVFKDSNSALTHNWVTSLCAAGDRLFIGTYGGGVFELSASSDLYGFAAEIGTPIVNPNAMWSDGQELFVGTLDGAWAFNLHSQKWTHLVDELPSKIVLSITGDEKYVYFGTTNGIARMEKSYLGGI